jgi:hypothetical protein
VLQCTNDRIADHLEGAALCVACPPLVARRFSSAVLS